MDRTIACLKWGNKYSPHYVNVLYNMCRRHNSEYFNFICFTDNSDGLDKEIIIKSLPNSSLHGWWYKPFVFCKENNIKGTVLFLDLDVIVYDNIDKLWNYRKNDFLIIRDFTKHMNPAWDKFNSSVFRFEADNCYWIWEKFYKEKTQIMSKMHGDQDYLYSILKNNAFHWPDNWIQSYKWEMRDKHDIILIDGKRNFKDIKDPKLTEECSIAVFHGEPNPHEVKDPWVIKNWK